jgi:hypothetical protein
LRTRFRQAGEAGRVPAEPFTSLKKQSGNGYVIIQSYNPVQQAAQSP